MKLSIASDHAGFALKSNLIPWLLSQGFDIIDMGCNSEESIDYPDYGHPVAHSVESKTTSFGILICGSGNGISMTANKHQDIRCALCWTPEISALARQHNDANILALPARFIDEATAMNIVHIFLTTPFEGGRHAKRVAKIACS